MGNKQIIIYAPEGGIKIEVPIDGQTVWLSQKQMSELFDTTKQNISLHLKNIFKERELSENLVVKEYLTAAEDGKEYLTQHYNLDAIISIGYRVNSARGAQFRIWATQKLKEYIVKGFVLDDERLAAGRKYGYFDELLERVRAIRASERNFYQKITDIYATSIDYKKDAEMTKKFFATVQNKIHYAVHGHTAAEVIAARADASKPRMGLTSFKGKMIREADVAVAKNYLSEDELKQLNLVVSLYLDFAELQASNKREMTMAAWIGKLDDFLKLSEKKVLLNAGKVSKELAEVKAKQEFEKFKVDQDKKYVSDFDREAKKLLNPKKQKGSSRVHR